MNGYKYFENGGKNMSFSIKNDEICEKYEDIWDVIKNKPGQKRKMYYTCIAMQAVIDSVMRMNKKNYPQVYLEDLFYKYKIKKIQMPRFINTELVTDSKPDL